MRTAPALVIVSLSLLALVGCVPDDDPVIPDPLPSSTPIFASDEEALAAAEEAFAAYLIASDQVGASGGLDVTPLEAVVTPQLLETLRASAQQYVDNDVHTDGESRFDSMQLEQYFDDLEESASVTAYVCLDVELVRVLNSANEDVTPVDRDSRLPLEVSFSTDRSTRATLLERSDVWDGSDFCG